MLIHVSLHPNCIEGSGPDQLSSDYRTTCGRTTKERHELTSLQRSNCMRFPASLGRITGYTLRRGQSAGTQAVIQPDSRWHCSPEVRSGVKLGHCSDVRCMTALPPKAEVHPRFCYVANVPEADSCIAAKCPAYSITSSATTRSVCSMSITS